MEHDGINMNNYDGTMMEMFWEYKVQKLFRSSHEPFMIMKDFGSDEVFILFDLKSESKNIGSHHIQSSTFFFCLSHS